MKLRCNQIDNSTINKRSEGIDYIFIDLKFLGAPLTGGPVKIAPFVPHLGGPDNLLLFLWEILIIWINSRSKFRLGFYYLEIAEMKFRQWLLIVQKIVEYAKIVSQTNGNYNEREREFNDRWTSVISTETLVMLYIIFCTWKYRIILTHLLFFQIFSYVIKVNESSTSGGSTAFFGCDKGKVVLNM